jgi:hypothetical protein
MPGNAWHLPVRFMNIQFKWSRITVILLVLTLTLSSKTSAEGLNQDSLVLQVGVADQLHTQAGGGAGRWTSSAPQVAEVFQNGFVVGLTPGQARVEIAGGLRRWTVDVEASHPPLVDPATLKQFPDNRQFTAGNRVCFGSELNGQRASSPEERRFTRSNRVINPKPLRPDKPLDWELEPGTEVYDGAGVSMGTVPATLKVGDRRVPVSMFNFGASKVLHGRICVYAFSVLVSASDLKGGKVATSAWLPLDRVVDKEALLERIGLGKAGLPALPLETKGYLITGEYPNKYMTDAGELSIVRQLEIGAVPSHYLRRPSGTVNLIYSVPGFGLGGQGVDSFLVSDGLKFYPAQGAKVFRQPTYFPIKHPQAGKVSPQTMTFLYGAIKSNGSEPIYGWIAKEALGPAE